MQANHIVMQFVWAYLAGAAATYGMDKMTGFAAQRGISTGVTIAEVGRWFLGMARGKFVYEDIAKAEPIKNEVTAGWYFHYLIGGGAVALPYPLLLMVLGKSIPGWQIVPGLIYGLLSVVLLWFVMLPAFGWGWFGKNGPPGTRMIAAGLLTHGSFGLGIGIFMSVIGLLGLM